MKVSFAWAQSPTRCCLAPGNRAEPVPGSRVIPRCLERGEQHSRLSEDEDGFAQCAALQGAQSDRVLMFSGERSMVGGLWSGIPGGAVPMGSRDHPWIHGLFPEGCVGAGSWSQQCLGAPVSFQSQLCSLCWSWAVPEQFLEAVPLNEPSCVNYIKLSCAMGWVWDNHNRLGS